MIPLPDKKYSIVNAIEAIVKQLNTEGLTIE